MPGLNDEFPLPCDILQEIFHWVVKTPIGQPLSGYCSNTRNELLALTHVSPFWRQAAIGRADLWAEVLDPREPSSDLFNLIYHNTRQAPLKIRVKLKQRKENEDSPLRNNPQWNLMLSNLHRMSVIAFQFKWDEDVEPILWALEKNETPLLKVLDIKCSSVFNGPMKFAPKQSIKTAQLLALRLDECVAPPEAFDLGSIEIFSLNRRKPGSAEILSWWNTCFSGRMSSLRELTMGYVRSLKTSNNWMDDGILVPPNLKRLDLNAAIGPCISLLALASDLPESCNVNIVCFAFPEDFSRTDEGSVNDLARSLVSFLSQLWDSTPNTTSSLELCISDFSLTLTHRSTWGRTVRLTIHFEEGDAIFVGQFLRWVSSEEYCPTVARNADTWLRLSVHIVHRDFAKELHQAFIGFLVHSKFSFQVQRLRLYRYTLGVSTVHEPDERWEEMNFLRVAPESEGVVLPSLKQIRIRDMVLKDAGFLHDFHFFEDGRLRCGYPVCVEKDNKLVGKLTVRDALERNEAFRSS